MQAATDGSPDLPACALSDSLCLNGSKSSPVEGNEDGCQVSRGHGGVLGGDLLGSRQQLVHRLLAVKALTGLLVLCCIPAASLTSAACALSR